MTYVMVLRASTWALAVGALAVAVGDVHPAAPLTMWVVLTALLLVADRYNTQYQ